MNTKKDYFYNQDIEEVQKYFNTSLEKGLSEIEVQKRREKYGANVLNETKKESGLRAFLNQYKDYMQIVLVIAACMSFFVKDYSTGTILLLITLGNAYFALKAQKRAEESVEALRKMMNMTARVLRDGKEVEIRVDEIVPGDIVLFESGDRIPADGRLFETASLEIEAAALTGETMPVPKTTITLNKEKVALGDRNNMAFMNTSVTKGRGKMIVTATGMQTQMGKIAQLLQDTEEEKSPLQKQVDSLTIVIAIMAGFAFIIMIITGLAKEIPFSELYGLAIILAIASLPSAMPVVVTTTLALGTREMAKRGAIVKKLTAVETLGSTSAICSDKTGTLTLNQMTARTLIIAKNRYDITGEGYKTDGHIKHIGGQHSPNLDPYLLPMALCTDAVLDGEELIGDPTEGALIVLAEKGNLSVEQTRKQYPRIAEIPFDSDYKFMATFHEMKNSQGENVVRCYIKGAPDVLLSKATQLKDPDNNTTRSLTDELRETIQKANDEMAQRGMRVLVVAKKDFAPKEFDAKDKNLIEKIQNITLLAMVGIVDPPRSQARDAIKKCKDAGIKVRMITGDHVVTASAIASQLGIDGKALTGQEFSAMSDEAILKDIDNIGVIARVTPEDKIRLISLLKQSNKIVAMTGDGVNDAPALKKADIGVAMGITGTDVSKEAATMILTDDNFATIVSAVEYGRIIYNNLLKFIRFQLAILSSFIISFTSAAALGITFSLFSPLQIIFVKFFVTGIIGTAFAFDTPTEDLMSQKPRKADEKIVKTPLMIRLFAIGSLVAIFSITAYTWALSTSNNELHAQTMAMVTFGLLAIPFSLNLRRPFGTVFSKTTLSNRKLLLAYGWIIAIMILITILPFLQNIFHTTPLTQQEWTFIGLASIIFLLGGEFFKWIVRLVQNNT
jgi:Ca2+-transporting ATPase